MEKIAYTISRILRPEFLTVVLILFLLTHTGLSSTQIHQLGIAFVIIEFLLPITFLQIYLKTHPGVTWELKNRKDRYPYLGFVAICSLVCLGLTRVLGNQLIFSLGLIIFALLLINVAITCFWKISLHMAGITIAVLIINYIVHWQYFYLLLLIPLVGWARYTLKRHTVGQIVAGFFVNTAILFLLLQIFQ